MDISVKNRSLLNEVHEKILEYKMDFIIMNEPIPEDLQQDQDECELIMSDQIRYENNELEEDELVEETFLAIREMNCYISDYLIQTYLY